jgi:uncharacterized protein (DUF1778 family)
VSKRTRTKSARKIRQQSAAAEWPDDLSLVLDEKRWKEFLAALARPPKDNPRLRALLARKPAWKS